MTKLLRIKHAAMLARPENTDRELLPTRILLAITGNAQGIYTIQKHHLERTAHQGLVCLEDNGACTIVDLLDVGR